MLKFSKIIQFKKIIFLLFIFAVIFINNTSAWLWLVAETWDILNTTKWNEMITEFDTKIAKINIEEWDNISLTDSGSNLIITAQDIQVGETPVITMTWVINMSINSTWVIEVFGSNFLPSSIVTLPWFPWTMNSFTPIAENQINISITTTSSTWSYSVVISNSGALNTSWTNNWINLLLVGFWIVWDDTLWRKYANWTYAESCKEYKNPTAPYNYSGNIWDWYYQLKQWVNPSFKAYCDMTTDGGGWTRFTDYTFSPWTYYVEDLWNITSNFTELFYSYQRETSQKFAFKFTKLWTKQCWIVHWHATDITLAIRDYVSHTEDWNWWSCSRTATAWDANDIITEKIIEWDFVDDVCLNWILHKTTARNYSRSTITDTYGHSVWEMSHRVSNSTVLFSSRWKGSTRCAWANSWIKRATKIYMFLR